MFPAQYIAVAFIAMMFIVFPFNFFDKRGFVTISKTMLIVGLICSIYCIAAGLSMAVGWEDPLSQANPEELASVSSKGGGKAGLYILIMKFWPYFLIGTGGWFGWQNYQLLKD